MTPQEVIEKRMLEVWGERNLARLERETGVPRESLSKILNYKRGLGPEVAAKLAPALKVDVAALQPPAAEAVSLVTLDRRLQSLEADVGRVVNLLERLLQGAREQAPRAGRSQRKAV